MRLPSSLCSPRRLLIPALCAIPFLGACASNRSEADAREKHWFGVQNQAMMALIENRDDQLAASLEEFWALKVQPVQPPGGIPPGEFNQTTAAALQRPIARARLEPVLRNSQSLLEQAVLSGTATPQQTWVWYDLVTIFDDVPSAIRVVEKATENPKVMAQLRKPSSKRKELERAMELSKRPDLAKAMEPRFQEKVADFLNGPGKPIPIVASSPVWLLR